MKNMISRIFCFKKPTLDTKERTLIIVALLLGPFPITASAQLDDFTFNSNRLIWPARVTTPNTLETHFERIFAEFGADCGISPYGSESAKVSFIPINIRKASSVLRLKTPVVVIPFDSAKRVMSFIFADSDINSISSSRRIDGTKFLITATDITAAPIPRIATDTFGFKHTCTSLLRATIDAKLKFPLASASAALGAEANETSNLIIVSGVFENPIYLKAKRQDPTTLLSFWSAYSVGGGYSENLRILKGFEGVIVIKAKTSDRKTEFKVNAATSISSPIFDGSLSAAAGIKDDRALNVTQYLNYIYAPTTTTTLFDGVPPPTLIKLAYERLNRTNSYPNGLVMFSDRLYAVDTDLPDIPYEMCNEQALGLDYAPGDARLKGGTGLTVREINADLPTRTCRIRLEGYKPDNVDAPSNFRLNYKIIGKNTLIENGKAVRLELPVSIDIRISNHPSYSPPVAPIESRMVGQVLEWTYALDILEFDRTWDKSRMQEVATDGAARIRCGTSDFAADHSVAIQSGRIQLTVKPTTGAGPFPQNVVCELTNLTLKLPATGNNVLVSHPITAKLHTP